jgi:hypothetical protein
MALFQRPLLLLLLLLLAPLPICFHAFLVRSSSLVSLPLSSWLCVDMLLAGWLGERAPVEASGSA